MYLRISLLCFQSTYSEPRSSLRSTTTCYASKIYCNITFTPSLRLPNSIRLSGLHWQLCVHSLQLSHMQHALVHLVQLNGVKYMSVLFYVGR